MIKKGVAPSGHLTTQEVQQRSVCPFWSTLSFASKEEDGWVPHDSPSGNVLQGTVLEEIPCSALLNGHRGGAGALLGVTCRPASTLPHGSHFQVSWSCS